MIWIAFMRPCDAQQFLNIVARYRPGLKSLYNRASVRWDEGDAVFWEYDVRPFDWNLEEEVDEVEGAIDESHVGASDFDFEISVRFPATDYPVVLRRMAAHNQRRGSRENQRTSNNLPGETTVPSAASI
jgi:hypothetical protein